MASQAHPVIILNTYKENGNKNAHTYTHTLAHAEYKRTHARYLKAREDKKKNIEGAVQ